MIGVVIVAAGSGERLGFGIPKAFVPLGDQPMASWSLAVFERHPENFRVVLVVPAVVPAVTLTGLDAGRTTTVTGGGTRQESVDRGLAALPADVELVLIHDAARPLVTAAAISAVVGALRAGADAVIPVLPVTDTVKRVGADGTVLATLERADLRLVQTPQGFRRSVLADAHRAAEEAGLSDVSDDAGLVEWLGGSVTTVPGDEVAFKITTTHDLDRARQLVASLRGGA